MFRRSLVIALYACLAVGDAEVWGEAFPSKRGSARKTFLARPAPTMKPLRRDLSVGLGIRGGAAAAATAASVSLKAALQAGLTVISVASWLGPLNTKSFVDSPAALSIANAFSGGVFLALAFGHLLPHAIHELSAFAASTAASATTQGAAASASGAALAAAPLFGGVAPEVVACAACLTGYLLIFIAEKVAFDTSSLTEGPVTTTAHHTGHSDNHGIAQVSHQAAAAAAKGRGAVLLLSALAVHSFVESAALGVQSSRKPAFLLAASIGLHQPAESVALLVALVKAGLPKRRVCLLLGLFALVGPLGCALGVAAKGAGVLGGFLEPVLVAATAGTFVYVGATEVVAEEFEGGHGRGGADASCLDATPAAVRGSRPASKATKAASFFGGMILISLVIAVTERLEAAAHAAAL